MSYYISQNGLIDRFGADTVAQLADRDGDEDNDANTVARAIRDAEGQINSFLGKQYALPLAGIVDVAEPENNSSVPDVLRSIAADVAIYRLAPSPDVLTREQRRRYEDALKWLEQVASGKVSLGVSESATPPGGGLVVTSNPRVFTRGTTDGLV